MMGLRMMLGIALLFVVACNAREERPDRDRRPGAPTGAATIEPTPATRAAPTVPNTPTRLAFKSGRNDYVLNVDNTPRQMIVYVASKYDPARPAPVVFMFHGSNQGGNLMYENTDWVNKAEKENTIVVFPTSWKYPLIGESGLHEKWNGWSLNQMVPPGTELKDDVHFVRVMVEALKATFNVDTRRTFATGFSNGGTFVLTRLMPELNDVFAAYATSGAGLLGTLEDGFDESKTTLRVNASLYSVLGTNDEKVSEATGHPRPFPIRVEDLNRDPLFHDMIVTTTTLLSLDMDYSAETQPSFTKFTFKRSLVGAKNEYIFLMIDNMGHVYPNGSNNRARLSASDLFWEFFLRHAKS